MADFLASIAKNYKGDPFGAGMGLMQAREATNFDPQKEREYYLKDDMAFIESAKEALKDGKEVVYTCWW